MKAYPAYQETGVEWIGAIPCHWSTARMRVVVDSIVNGVWGDEPQGDKNDLVCVRVADFDMLTLGVSREKLTTRNIPQNQQGERLLFKDDLLIEKSGGGDISPVGRVIRFDLDEKAVCSNFIGKVSVNKANVLPSFLLYYTTNLYSKAVNTRSIKQTTGIQNLDTYSYFSERISIPTLPEQQAIADFLDRKTAQIDTLIAKKQRQIELLQELINQAVTKGLNPSAPLKDSGVEWLGEIPSHWEVVKLKYIGKAFIGLTYNPENVTDEENGTLVFRASNVQDEKIVFDDNVYVKMEIPERLITKVGDILICVRSGSRDLIGKNALIDEKSAGHAFGAFMTVFRSDINYFLSYVFKSQLFKVQSGIFNTSTVNQLTQGSLYSFQVAIPPFGEQEEIIQVLNNELAQIDETTNRVATQIELLQEYRTALISEAVTGKIDVRA
jgi:type I restriction enzyme S subunit